jgi:hypothetical protein
MSLGNRLAMRVTSLPAGARRTPSAMPVGAELLAPVTPLFTPMKSGFCGGPSAHGSCG